MEIAHPMPARPRATRLVMTRPNQTDATLSLHRAIEDSKDRSENGKELVGWSGEKGGI